jgi:hypothetical protein
MTEQSAPNGLSAKEADIPAPYRISYQASRACDPFQKMNLKIFAHGVMPRLSMICPAEDASRPNEPHLARRDGCANVHRRSKPSRLDSQRLSFADDLSELPALSLAERYALPRRKRRLLTHAGRTDAYAPRLSRNRE